MSSLIKHSINSMVKANNGYKLELNELNKELEKNNIYLKELKNNKTKKNLEASQERSKDDIHNIHLEEYRKIKEQLMLYYEIGENEHKFNHFYNKGILDEKLSEFYEPQELETIKTYFKKKK